MAASILLYLLKANAALLLFAAAYFGLLRRLTFFTLNRFYLVFALLFAAMYPALPVPALLPAEAVPPMTFAVPIVAGPNANPAAGPVVGAAIDWAAVGLGLYAAGAAVLLARLLVQLLSLWRLRRAAPWVVVQGQPVRALARPVSPFSFWRTIYLNPGQHPAPELAAVLRHEQVHVRQWHTLDVLLAQVAQALAWCNPAVWLLRRALLDNLEYLADHAALQTGLDRQAYQYSLLRLSRGTAGPSLVSHFTFPTLKNRVVMMNSPLSSTGQLARYFVAGPLVLALALGFAAARAQGAGPVEPAGGPGPALPVAQAAPVAAAPVLTSAPRPAAPAVAAPRPTFKPAVPRPAAARPATPAVAQPATVAAPQPGNPPIYYVDGQRYYGDVNALKPSEILSMHVLKNERARQLFSEAGTAGVVIVTTRGNQDAPAVLAFNEKLGLGAAPDVVPPVAATAKPGRVASLAPGALAYITKTYPGARLLGVREVPGVDGGAARYQADIALGRRPGYLLFDVQGNFISEAYTSYAR